MATKTKSPNDGRQRGKPGAKPPPPPEEPTLKVLADNRKAFFNYAIDRKIEAGLALTGTEIKSVRAGRVNLVDGYAKIDKGQAWLRNVHIAPWTHASFENHDPTTRNRQGPDVGDQYRSEIFTFSPAQEASARAAKNAKEPAAAKRGKSVVTLIEPVGRFWKAEEYHQQYDEKTGTHSCPLPKGLPKST